jgi:proteasome lid subunit RPN8/RPN11
VPEEEPRLGDQIRPRTTGSDGQAGRAPEVAIVEAVRDQIDAHVAGDTKVERGGVLVGIVDKMTGRVDITGAVAATTAVGAVSSLTFTHETWDEVDAEMSHNYPDQEIVGWYHSHPHFGIFLSAYDLFIQENFFAEPWQVAYVVDPLLHKSGFFGWERGEIIRLQRWAVFGSLGALGVGTPDRDVVLPRVATNAKGTNGQQLTRSLGSLGVLLFAVGLLVGAVAGYLVNNSSPPPASNSVSSPVGSTGPIPVAVSGIPAGLQVTRSWVATPKQEVVVVAVQLTGATTSIGNQPIDATLTNCAPLGFVAAYPSEPVPLTQNDGSAATSLSNGAGPEGQGSGNADSTAQITRAGAGNQWIDKATTPSSPWPFPTASSSYPASRNDTIPDSAITPLRSAPVIVATPAHAILMMLYSARSTRKAPHTPVSTPPTTEPEGTDCTIEGAVDPDSSLITVMTGAKDSTGSFGGPSWQPTSRSKWIPLQTNNPGT